MFITTSNSPPEYLAGSTEMVRATAWICVHALTQKLQIFHCKQILETVFKKTIKSNGNVARGAFNK